MPPPAKPAAVPPPEPAAVPPPAAPLDVPPPAKIPPPAPSPADPNACVAYTAVPFEENRGVGIGGPPGPGCSPPPTSCTDLCDDLLQLIHVKRVAAYWTRYYAEIAQWLEQHGYAEGTFVEIGTAFGGLAAALLTHLPKLHVISVDPFLAGYDATDSQSRLYDELRVAKEDPPQVKGEGPPVVEELSPLQQAVLRIGKRKPSAAALSSAWATALAFELGNAFPCRYTLHHAFSEPVAKQYTSGVDVVFVDGDHTYKGAALDIKSWAGLARKAVLFNDYTPVAPRFLGMCEEGRAMEVYFIGVNQAVDEWVDGKKLKLEVVGNNIYRNVAVDFV